MITLILVFARLISLLPEFLQKFLCFLGGRFIYYCLPSKRRTILTNLYSAFPERSEAWRRNLAKKNCSNWAETTLFFFVSPFWAKLKIQDKVSLDKSFVEFINAQNDVNKPNVILVPHFSMMESITACPIFFKKFPLTGVAYRPLGIRAIDDWICKTRERFGIRLMSRKKGFLPMRSVLKKNGLMAVLFDQSAGEAGLLTSFFNRLSSSTDLPGKLAEMSGAQVGFVYAKRQGFLKSKLFYEPLDCNVNSTEVTLKANLWLEKKLQEDEVLCEDWLWLHKRWKIQELPYRRFSIGHKRNALKETLELSGKDSLPKKIRVWIRMPNWLGDVVMAIPALRAIRSARPDFEINLILREQFVELLKPLNLADNFMPLPNKGIKYFCSFFKLRKLYPELFIAFTNSTRGDLEGIIMGARQRIGVEKKSKRRLLTHSYRLEKRELEIHQTLIWYKMLKAFGLKEKIDLSPISEKNENVNKFRIGFFCGSANTPSKRWPIKNWIDLIRLFLSSHEEVECVLFGSKDDSLITDAILTNLDDDRVENLAGKTSLKELSDEIRNCSFVVSNDTGGMHLANALGVRVAAIYGPTDPRLAGPIFESKALILKKGEDITSLSPTYVYEKVRANFASDI